MRRLATRLRETCERADVKSIVVVAPRHFAEMMRAGFGSALWGRVQHTVPRDRGTIVTDVAWVRDATQLAGFMMPCPVRVFANRERGAAIE